MIQRGKRYVVEITYTDGETKVIIRGNIMSKRSNGRLVKADLIREYGKNWGAQRLTEAREMVYRAALDNGFTDARVWKLLKEGATA